MSASGFIGLAAFFAALTVSGCGSGQPDTLPPEQAYIAALTTELTVDRPADRTAGADPTTNDGDGTDDDTDDGDELRIVYVADLSIEPLSIEGQVTVIDAFAESTDLRFVDEPEPIVDENHPELVPLNDGVLYGVSIVEINPRSAVIRLERYEHNTDITAELVTVSAEQTDDKWTTTVTDVEPVEPERLNALGE